MAPYTVDWNFFFMLRNDQSRRFLVVTSHSCEVINILLKFTLRIIKENKNLQTVFKLH
jgi:hypothetical protein